jgi:hypothetical protein
VHPLPRSGTVWNTVQPDIPLIVTPPFDIDGVADFSAEELNIIIAVWQAVTEDFAAFDVDVTLEDPGVQGLVRRSIFFDDVNYGIRVCIGGSSFDW